MENEPLQLVRKLIVYGCNSFEKRRLLQEFLEKSGLIVQDYQFNFKEDSVVFRFSLRVKIADLKEKIEKSPWALHYEILSPQNRGC